MKKSDVPSAAEFSGMHPLDTAKALFVRLSQSRRGERQANRCDARHQPYALPWSTGATSVRGTPDEEKERLARENGLHLEYVG